MQVTLNKLVIAEVPIYDTANILPAGTVVDVLNDDYDWTQVVAVSFPDENFNWLVDGRLLVIDWMVFRDASGEDGL